MTHNEKAISMGENVGRCIFLCCCLACIKWEKWLMVQEKLDAARRCWRRSRSAGRTDSEQRTAAGGYYREEQQKIQRQVIMRILQVTIRSRRMFMRQLKLFILSKDNLKSVLYCRTLEFCSDRSWTASVDSTPTNCPVRFPVVHTTVNMCDVVIVVQMNGNNFKSVFYPFSRLG